MTSILFSPEMLDAFRLASHDRNPLHGDANYARLTPFGKPVVFGVLGVLSALDRWAGVREFRIEKIRANFLKPLFCGREYTLEVEEIGNDVTLRLKRGTSTQCQISFTWQSYASSGSFRTHTPTCSRAVPSTSGSNFDRSGQAYAPDLSAWRWPRIPESQLATLLWTSYFVGMECPGKQALFSALSLTFDYNPTNDSSIRMGPIETKVDTRFKQTIVSAQGTGITSLRLDAFKRPEPIHHTYSEILAVVDKGTELQNRVALITGAGRGFGAVLAQSLAMRGATVCLNIRSKSVESEALVSSLNREGLKVYLLVGDASDRKDWEKMKESLASRNLELDLLINNASPVIESLEFFEQGTESMVEFVSKCLRLCALPCEELLPRLKKGAQIVQISSTYALQPEGALSHYSAAKSAIEGFTRGLAKDHRKIRFIVARLPRMLTDQTNAAFSSLEAKSSIDLAAEFVKRIVKQAEEDLNYQEWTF